MTATLARIIRHPIKAHGREDLASVRLSAGECLPFDREWAVYHDAARLTGGWVSCANFHRGAKAPALMAIACRLEEATRRITLTHPDRPALTFCPDDPADVAAFLAWLAPLNPADRVAPAGITRAGRGMTDSDFPSVAVLGLPSLRALSQRVGRDLSPHRFRGNLWLDGIAPWEEFDWPGRRLRVGGAVLEVRERITRCRATMADPDTGRIDTDTLGALDDGWGHQDFGVYCTVLQGGTITPGDRVEVLA